MSVLVDNPNWLPWLTAPTLREQAATIWEANPVPSKGAGLPRKGPKAARWRALHLIADIKAAWDASVAKQNEAANVKRAAADKANAEARLAAIAVAAESLDALLARALRHCDKARWTNHGSWSSRRWQLEHHDNRPHQANPYWLEANGEAYYALVAILGRAATNEGGGIKTDITAETPNKPAAVRLARDIVSGKNVAPPRLLAIADAHARAWAVNRCGGWSKLRKAFPVLEKTKGGSLLDGNAMGLACDLLMVRDSTTRKVFVLGVPRQNQLRYRNVKHALRFLNQCSPTAIVAES